MWRMNMEYVFEEWYDQLGGEASPLADAIH